MLNESHWSHFVKNERNKAESTFLAVRQTDTCEF